MKLYILNRIVYLGILIISIFLSVELGYALTPKDKPEIEIKSESKDVLSVINKAPKPEPYVYNSKNKKDPFVPIFIMLKEVPKEKKFIKLKGWFTPFEDFDIKSIKIISIIQLGDEFIATGVIPDKRAFQIRVGTRLGKRGGIVSKIDLEKVVVDEEYFDEKGIKNTLETSIGIKK
jgi:Tfp pilus assembly protein PilP